MYCHVYEWLLTGIGLDIGFIDDFNTQLVITLNYSAIADHTLQITSAYGLVFCLLQLPLAFWQWLFLCFCAQILSGWRLSFKSTDF
jgi:hypothetical protein